ncbi:acyl-CoA dehydrogenase family protein [Sphingobium sp.]|uniref:acyl-CoA dehydrogenase family protein n=1 Tax=Sphingobium sp. TaxID=1912891 RepID=UPI003B3B1E59
MMRFTDEQRAFQETIRRFVEAEVAPVADRIDEDDAIGRELIEKFGDMGLLQLWVPESYGGPGGDLTLVCIAKEEIAKYSLSASALCANNSIGLILPVLALGTQAQKDRYLAQAAGGRLITAIAMTEPQAGSDVTAIRTRARRDGDSYVINGQKTWITWGSMADYVLLIARTSDEPGHGSLSAFLVDTRLPGFRVGNRERKMGRHGAPSDELLFEDMRVPADCLIGSEGGGFKACMKILDLNRPTIAASSLGLAQGALDVACRYVKERQQFGRPVGQFQGVQFRLADMAMKVAACRSLLYDSTAALDADAGADVTLLSSISKCYVTDRAMEVTTDAVQILGGYGYSKDFPVERMMRDAKLNQIIEGTNDIHRMIIGRKLVA